MNKLSIILTACCLSLICPLMVSADIPMMINYQGYVEDDTGSPIEGNVYLKFAIVSGNGNVTYWSNDNTSSNGGEPDDAITVNASNGVFSIKLGNPDLGMASLDTSPFENQDIYIRVWFSDNNTTFEQLSPDTQIVSTGFAYKAQSLVGGLSWTQLTDIPADFNDGTVDWSELTNIPAGFADNIDNEGGGGTETDPVFSASSAAGISGSNITNWNTAYSWGNHASQGYLTTETGDITEVRSGEGTQGGVTSGIATIQFDCSEVAGSGIRCNGEDIEVYSLRGYNAGTENAIFAANDGSIGIGTTSPSEKLHVVGDSMFSVGGGSISVSTPGGWPGFITYAPNGNRRDIQFYNTGTAITISNTSSAPAGARGIWIDESTGFVGLGDTAPAYRLEVNGDVNTINGGYRDSSSCVAGTCGSDKRLKKNILPLQNARQIIDRLEPVTYEFIDEKLGSGTQYGLLAQDVEEIFPEWVVEDQDGIKKIRYGLQFQMFLIQAVKEQQEIIAAMDKRINELETIKKTEISTLKHQLNQLQKVVETVLVQQPQNLEASLAIPPNEPKEIVN